MSNNSSTFKLTIVKLATMKSNRLQKKVILEVFSVFGQQIYSQIIVRDNQVDLSTVRKGVYILRVKNNTETIGQTKIIIK